MHRGETSLTLEHTLSSHSVGADIKPLGRDGHQVIRSGWAPAADTPPYLVLSCLALSCLTVLPCPVQCVVQCSAVSVAVNKAPALTWPPSSIDILIVHVLAPSVPAFHLNHSNRTARMPTTRSLRSSALTKPPNSPPTRSSAIIQHSSASSTNPSIRLTVKAPPSKLRQAISGSDLPPNPYQDDLESDTPDPPPRPSRTTRNPRTVVEPESDEEEEDDEDDDLEDASQDDDDADGNDLSENEDDGDDDDDEEDNDDDDMDTDDPHPAPPVIAAIPSKTAKASSKQSDTITVAVPPISNTLKSVEAKEMDDDDDDDELSELEDEEEIEDEEDQDQDQDQDQEQDQDSDLDDDDDDETRDGTPDLSKLTRRQRAAYDDSLEQGGLMALSNEAQKKKHLTAEEISMRRAEMARRRKNLSEKRNEEEKVRHHYHHPLPTINLVFVTISPSLLSFSPPSYRSHSRITDTPFLPFPH